MFYRLTDLSVSFVAELIAGIVGDCIGALTVSDRLYCHYIAGEAVGRSALLYIEDGSAGACLLHNVGYCLFLSDRDLIALSSGRRV